MCHDSKNKNKIIIMSCHYCKCNKYSDTFYLSATNENGVIISCKVTLIKSRQEFIVESCVLLVFLELL